MEQTGRMTTTTASTSTGGTPSDRALSGRTALVTGGARGIGHAIASALAAAGANVCLVDVLDGAAAAQRLVDEHGVRCTAVQADVTSATSTGAAFDHAERELRTCDVLVTAAGISLDGEALDLPLARWQRALDVNLTGTFLTCQEFARRAVAAQRPASIVAISSMSGFVVNVPQRQAAYNVSKAGVAMLAQSLAVEWLPLGIRVNAIAPGYFATEMTRADLEGDSDHARVWRERTPAGRPGQPHELGPLAVYLASDQSAFLVGQNIVIDGGYTAV